jgi:hypothetical protein
MANKVTIKATIVLDDIDFGDLTYADCKRLMFARIVKDKVFYETRNEKVTVLHRLNKGDD